MDLLNNIEIINVKDNRVFEIYLNKNKYIVNLGVRFICERVFYISKINGERGGYFLVNDLLEYNKYTNLSPQIIFKNNNISDEQYNEFPEELKKIVGKMVKLYYTSSFS